MVKSLEGQTDKDQRSTSLRLTSITHTFGTQDSTKEEDFYYISARMRKKNFRKDLFLTVYICSLNMHQQSYGSYSCFLSVTHNDWSFINIPQVQLLRHKMHLHHFVHILLSRRIFIYAFLPVRFFSNSSKYVVERL